MLITVADAAISNLVDEKGTSKAPAVRIVIGGWLVTVVLLVASDSQPDLVAGFATLIMLGSIFGPNGAASLKIVQKVLNTAAVPLRRTVTTSGLEVGPGVSMSGQGVGNQGNFGWTTAEQ